MDSNRSVESKLSGNTKPNRKAPNVRHQAHCGPKSWLWHLAGLLGLVTPTFSSTNWGKWVNYLLSVAWRFNWDSVLKGLGVTSCRKCEPQITNVIFHYCYFKNLPLLNFIWQVLLSNELIIFFRSHSGRCSPVLINNINGTSYEILSAVRHITF